MRLTSGITSKKKPLFTHGITNNKEEKDLKPKGYFQDLKTSR